MIDPRDILKSYFETGDVPTQDQFADLIDSYVHKLDDGVTVFNLTPPVPDPDPTNPSTRFGVGITTPEARLGILADKLNGSLISFHALPSPAAASWFLNLATSNNSGIRFSEAVTGGDNRFFIQHSTGYIGVGTQTPGDMLHLEGLNAGGALGMLIRNMNSKNFGWRIGNQNGPDAEPTQNGDLSFIEQAVGGAMERLTLSAGGNLGVGTINPDILLHVFGQYSNPNSRIALGTGTGLAMVGQIEGNNIVFDTQGLQARGANHYDPSHPQVFNVIYADLNLQPQGGNINIHGGLTDVTDQTKKGIITLDGLMGLGTITPQERIDIDGAIRVGANKANNPGTIRYSTASSDLEGFVNGAWHSLTGGGGASSAWAAVAAGINYAGSGNVGIGDDAPGMKLSVNGAVKVGDVTDGINGAIRFSNKSTGLYDFEGFINGQWKSFTDGSVSQFWQQGTGGIFYPDGNVGIGDLTPPTKLSVNGGLKVGDSSDAVNGVIRYSNKTTGNYDLEAYINGQWKTLTAQPVAQPWTQGLGRIFYMDGNVGIGDTAPATKLSVNGSIKVGDATDAVSGAIRYSSKSGGIFDLEGCVNGEWKSLTGGSGSSYWQQAAGNIFYSDGNVGVGTGTPALKLSVNGGIQVGDTVAPVEGAIRYSNRSGAFDFEGYFNSAWHSFTSEAAPQPWEQGGGNVFYMVGNVGVGFDTPATKLAVNGAVQLGDSTSNVNGSIRYSSKSGGAFDLEGCINGEWKSLTAQPTAQPWQQAAGNVFYLTGNVGVGDSSPATKLSVGGAVKFGDSATDVLGSIRYSSTSLDLEGYVNGEWKSLTNVGTQPWIVDHGNVLYMAGNVGVNDANPTTKLSIGGAIKLGDSTADVAGSIRYSNKSGAFDLEGFINGEWRSLSAKGSQPWTVGSGLISYDGNVGVGDTAPATKLSVSGAIKLGNSTSDVLGSIRYSSTSLDLEGYVNGQWKSLTSVGTQPWTVGSGLISYDGNVGVGDTAPGQKLSVAGGIKLGDTTTALDGTIRYSSKSGAGFTFEGYYSGQWHSFTNQPWQIGSGLISYNGSVGIGDGAPATKLSVNGAVKFGDSTSNVTGSIRYSTASGDLEGFVSGEWKSLTAGGSGGTQPWVQSGNDIYYANGKVGIGTTPDSASFQVLQSGGVDNPTAALIQNNANDGGNSFRVGLQIANDEAWSGTSYDIGLYVSSVNGTPNSEKNIAALVNGNLVMGDVDSGAKLVGRNGTNVMSMFRGTAPIDSNGAVQMYADRTTDAGAATVLNVMDSLGNVVRLFKGASITADDQPQNFPNQYESAIQLLTIMRQRITDLESRLTAFGLLDDK